jgi:hypothetical protein
MTTINQLSGTTGSVSPSDQIALFNSNSQTTRRCTVAQFQEAMEAGFVPVGGVLALSSVYVMRGVTPSAVPLTTTPTPFNATQYSSPSFTLPAGNGSFVMDPPNGRFIATRDIQAIQVWAAVNGDWPIGNILTLSILLGDQVTPFTSNFQFTSGGVGPGFILTGTLAGVTTNLNDPLGFIRAGQTVRMVASLSAPGTLNLTRIAIAIQTLDGK